MNQFRVVASITFTFGLAASAFGQQPVRLVAIPTRVPSVVRRSNDLGRSNPDRILHMAVSLPYGDPAGIAAFVDSVSDPASPNYRHFLTPEEVGARFGLDDKHLQSVVDHLKSAGLNINLVAKNRLNILAEGTVAQAEKAFNTSIHEFQARNADEPGNARYFSYTSDPTLPESIAPYVIDVTGLESFTKPQLRILTPTQTRTLYSLATMYAAGKQGQGRTVGISNWDGYRLSNVPPYYTQYSLPTPPGGVGSNITVVTISGGSGPGSPGGEGDLDIQMVLGMAPLCNLRIYDGGSSDLIGVLTSEVNDNLSDVISESYGWNLSAATATSAHNIHVSMSAQGITYMAASGDNGTTLEPFSYPDYDPEVLMVGGTIATTNGAGVRTSEVGWSGSGGGWSTNTATFNVLPSWQHGNGVPIGVNHRLVPDVALNAAGQSGAYFFYFNGSLSSGSVGTSFASPVFAGALAVCEQQIISQGGLPPNGAGKRRFGRIQDLIYSQNGRSDVWFDVTSGNNGNLPGGGASVAGAGWDYVTGWGAINFDAFVGTQARDCNSNGIPDNQDITNGTSQDCNSDIIPDECQVPPLCPTCADCNHDGIPDNCQVPPRCPACPDCNANGIPDACETDCNGNGRPDQCDITSGTSHDCQPDNVPDECQLPPICPTCPDCNQNNIPDFCELAGNDCNSDGIPDRCQTDPLLCGGNCLADCDHNFVPDVCQLVGQFSQQSPELAPIYGTSPQSYTLIAPPHATGDVVLEFHAMADLGSLSENIAMNINGTPIGTLFSVSFDCILDIQSITLSAATYNGIVNGGNATINMSPSVSVDAPSCPSSHISVKVTYPISSGDCNNNSILDVCEIASGSQTDCNANGVPDSCDIVNGILTDGDSNNIPDECDCNLFSCRGDLDLDAVVSGADVQLFIDCLVSGSLMNSCACADLNGDLRLNSADVQALVARLVLDPNLNCH